MVQRQTTLIFDATANNNNNINNNDDNNNVYLTKPKTQQEQFKSIVD